VGPDDQTARSTTLLRERAHGLNRRLPRAVAGEEEAIHQMRVGGRRLRVALALLARKPKGRRVRRALRGLRALARAAGTSRDLDVGVSLLEERLRELPRSPERTLLRSRLKAARTRSHTAMAEALLDLEIATLRRDLRRIVRRGGDSVFSVLLRMRRMRDLEGQAVFVRLTELGERFEPDALHRTRIGVRRLRYAAELASRLRSEESQATEIFRELQENLGHIHDAWVLALWLASQATKAESRGAMALATEARALEAWFADRSRGAHNALLDAHPLERLRRGLDLMCAARSAA
jgi:CHAD domain-containing protein